MALKVGEKAPDFELYGKEAGADAPTYRLSDALARGGVVLQFFPLPFTRTCLAQMCAVRDDVDRYSGRGVTVWGVTGHYPHLIAAWDRENDFGVPILADYDHQVSRTYVGLYEDVLPLNLRLTTKRGVVGISRDGPSGTCGSPRRPARRPPMRSWAQPSEPQRADSGHPSAGSHSTVPSANVPR